MYEIKRIIKLGMFNHIRQMSTRDSVNVRRLVFRASVYPATGCEQWRRQQWGSVTRRAPPGLCIESAVLYIITCAASTGETGTECFETTCMYTTVYRVRDGCKILWACSQTDRRTVGWSKKTFANGGEEEDCNWRRERQTASEVAKSNFILIQTAWKKSF